MREQLFMVAALDYHAVFKHHDCVRVADGGKTVRDDERRSVPDDRVHALFDVPLGAGVDAAGRFVKYEDRRFGNRGAGNVEKLTLSL